MGALETLRRPDEEVVSVDSPASLEASSGV